LRGSPRFGLRLAIGVAGSSLRLYWTGALVAVVLGIVGLGVQASVRSLGQPADQGETRLALPPIPAAEADLAGSAASIEPAALQARAIQQVYQLLLILAWAALLIAAISMLTRFTAQAAGRGPEIGVRRAAGASRRDLLLALFLEGAMLMLVILVVGLPASALMLRLSVAAWPGMLPAATLLSWAATLSVGVVVAYGALAPLRYSGSRHMRSQADGQVLLAVPTFQLAMSLTILMGSGGLLQDQPNAPVPSAAVAGGPALLLTMSGGAASPEQRSRELAALLGTIGHSPGVAGVSLASPGTVLGLGRVDDATTDCGQCYRGGIQLRFDLHTATHHLVSPDTFSAAGIHLLNGRDFSEADRWGGQRVAVVSRHLAVSGFEAAGAVGRDLYLGDDWPNRPYRVIGVVEDSRRTGMGSALEPLDTIYLSVLQHPPKNAELLVLGEPGMSGSGLAKLVQARAGSGWRAKALGSPQELVAGAVLPVRWFGRGFTAVGLVVLLGALAGTFGTMRMWVESCIAEIAARRAVGATRLRIIGWVMGRTAGVGVKGVLLGVFLYVSVLRVSLTSLVGQIPVTDPAVVAGLAGLLVGAAVLGAMIPTVGLLRRPIASLFS
jgi:hypothetical protein